MFCLFGLFSVVCFELSVPVQVEVCLNDMHYINSHFTLLYFTLQHPA